METRDSKAAQTFTWTAPLETRERIFRCGGGGWNQTLSSLTSSFNNHISFIGFIFKYLYLSRQLKSHEKVYV